MKKKKSNFPHGWDEERVRRVLEYYEGQTPEEAIAEDEAAFESNKSAFVEIPIELVPTVRRLLVRKKRSVPKKRKAAVKRKTSKIPARNSA